MLGCSAQTLSTRVKRSQRDVGARPGVTTDEQARVKALEREVNQRCRANEILRKANTCPFATLSAWRKLEAGTQTDSSNQRTLDVHRSKGRALFNSSGQ